MPPENHEAVTEVLPPAEMRLMTTETPLLPTETPQNKEKENTENKSRRKEYSPHPPSENEGGVEKKTIEEMKELFLQPDCVQNRSTHNTEDLPERLFSVGVHNSKDMATLLRLSNYGEKGHLLWGIIAHGKWVGEKTGR